MLKGRSRPGQLNLTQPPQFPKPRFRPWIASREWRTALASWLQEMHIHEILMQPMLFWAEALNCPPLQCRFVSMIVPRSKSTVSWMQVLSSELKTAIRCQDKIFGGTLVYFINRLAIRTDETLLPRSSEPVLSAQLVFFIPTSCPCHYPPPI